jgi:ABC-type Zn2+ transport system substrate-binding protein/surface adhesin
VSCGPVGGRVARPGWANGRPVIAFFDGDGSPHRLLMLESDVETGAIASLYAWVLDDLSAFA